VIVTENGLSSEATIKITVASEVVVTPLPSTSPEISAAKTSFGDQEPVAFTMTHYTAGKEYQLFIDGQAFDLPELDNSVTIVGKTISVNSNPTDSTIVNIFVTGLGIGNHTLQVGEKGKGPTPQIIEIEITDLTPPVIKDFVISNIHQESGIRVGDNVTLRLFVKDSSKKIHFDVDWGDGNQSKFGQIDISLGEFGKAEHVYQRAGTYQVKISVFDEAGNTVEDSLEEIVYLEDPVPHVEVAKTLGNELNTRDSFFLIWNEVPTAIEYRVHRVTYSELNNYTQGEIIYKGTDHIYGGIFDFTVAKDTTYYFFVEAIDSEGHSSVTPKWGGLITRDLTLLSTRLALHSSREFYQGDLAYLSIRNPLGSTETQLTLKGYGDNGKDTVVEVGGEAMDGVKASSFEEKGDTTIIIQGLKAGVHIITVQHYGYPIGEVTLDIKVRVDDLLAEPVIGNPPPHIKPGTTFEIPLSDIDLV
jgi:hypothetical protein